MAYEIIVSLKNSLIDFFVFSDKPKRYFFSNINHEQVTL